MLFSSFLILLGIILLYYGGELLVSNSVRLARLWGMSPLTIGLTVVAFGTSSPELAATLVASFRDASAIAVGAVIGSNISNIALILGLSALIYPIPSKRKFNRREMPFMIFTSALVLPLFIGGVLSRWDGLILLGFLAFYLWYVLKHSNEAPPPVEIDLEALEAAPQVPVWGALLGVLVGIGLLTGGAQSLVEGASSIALSFGIPEKVIGLTLVAFGTSLPELASCVVAAMRKEGDIILGNIVGSNIFNVLCILGTAAVCKPLALPMAEITIDYGVMMAFSLILVPFLLTGVSLRRVEGAFLFLGYVSYVFYLYVLM
ncbi:MAG: calcium/sodium antiporter [Candidatus Hinthialibacter antarcticus]|nr:calcium/sodium antiporter [Candidatus Hinthialibacter antarcticus]